MENRLIEKPPGPVSNEESSKRANKTTPQGVFSQLTLLTKDSHSKSRRERQLYRIDAAHIKSGAITVKDNKMVQHKNGCRDWSQPLLSAGYTRKCSEYGARARLKSAKKRKGINRIIKSKPTLPPNRASCLYTLGECCSRILFHFGSHRKTDRWIVGFVSSRVYVLPGVVVPGITLKLNIK